MPKGYGQISRDFAQRTARVVREAERQGTQPLRARGRGASQQDTFGFACENNSAETIPAYGCIRLTNAGGGDGYGGLVLDGDKPNTYGSQGMHVFAGADEIPAGEIGTAYACQFGGYFLGQYVQAYYDNSDGTPAFGEMWGPRNATWKLKKNTGGFRVLGVTDSTNHLVLVRPEPMLTVRGKFGSDLAAGSSADLTVWTGSFGSEATTSVTISSVKNCTSCTVKGTPKFATAQWVPDNGGWQVSIFEV